MKISLLRGNLIEQENIKRVMKEGVVMSKVNVKTKSAGVKLEDIKAQLMEDAEFEEEYNKLQHK